MNPSEKSGPSEAPVQAAPPSGKVLSREFSEFLIELSIAIHQHGMYPPGHPSLEPAAINVTDRATYLLKGRGTLSLGAAKDQLVIEGVASDVNNPLMRELAGRLRRHHLGAISFHQGVSKQEVLQFLTLMAEEPDLHVRSVLDLALRRSDPEIVVAARPVKDGGDWGVWGG